VRVISVRRMSLARNVADMRETGNLHMEFELRKLKISFVDSAYAEE
jgi:hypothetical protein